jgi:hypothetical protein
MLAIANPHVLLREGYRNGREDKIKAVGTSVSCV